MDFYEATRAQRKHEVTEALANYRQEMSAINDMRKDLYRREMEAFYLLKHVLDLDQPKHTPLFNEVY